MTLLLIKEKLFLFGEFGLSKSEYLDNNYGYGDADTNILCGVFDDSEYCHLESINTLSLTNLLLVGLNRTKLNKHYEFSKRKYISYPK